MDIVVGIIANPASARDVRRLVALGGAMTTHDKLNRLQRVMAGLAAAGVTRVISMADDGGIMAGLYRLSQRASALGWPTIEFVDQPITETAKDTTVATQAMVEAGVGSIVVLGGDGTNRVVAAASADVPLVSISTGTNNAFPRPVEPTIAGIAAGLVATHRRCRQAGTYRAKRLTVRHKDRVETAVVDVAIATTDVVGSGAIWDPTAVTELFLCFAESDAIGLSAIGGHVQPTGRRSPQGLALTFGEPAMTTVSPPISPGLVRPVSVETIATLELDAPRTAVTAAGVVAVDGERLFRFDTANRPVVTLQNDGPIVVDVPATLDFAASQGFLTSAPASPTSSPTAPEPPISTTTDTTPRGSHSETAQPARSLYRDGPNPPIRIPHTAGVSR